MAPVQLRLTLRRAPDYRREAFIRSDSNAAAAEAMETWPDVRSHAWRGGAMVLMGPPGSGKTHLANIWAERTGASFVASDLALAAIPALAGPVVVEDVDRGPAGEALFHLFNRSALGGRDLLITARTPPAAWITQVADLRSRLNTLPVVALAEPDDAVLEALLRKLFAERNIRPAPDLLSYLAFRMERSAAAAFAVVERLDEAADALGRPVSRALAREILDGHEAQEPADAPQTGEDRQS